VSSFLFPHRNPPPAWNFSLFFFCKRVMPSQNSPIRVDFRIFFFLNFSLFFYPPRPSSFFDNPPLLAGGKTICDSFPFFLYDRRLPFCTTELGFFSQPYFAPGSILSFLCVNRLDSTQRWLTTLIFPRRISDFSCLARPDHNSP